MTLSRVALESAVCIGLCLLLKWVQLAPCASWGVGPAAGAVVAVEGARQHCCILLELSVLSHGELLVPD